MAVTVNFHVHSDMGQQFTSRLVKSNDSPTQWLVMECLDKETRHVDGEVSCFLDDEALRQLLVTIAEFLGKKGNILRFLVTYRPALKKDLESEYFSTLREAQEFLEKKANNFLDSGEPVPDADDWSISFIMGGLQVKDEFDKGILVKAVLE